MAGKIANQMGPGLGNTVGAALIRNLGSRSLAALPLLYGRRRCPCQAGRAPRECLLHAPTHGLVPAYDNLWQFPCSHTERQLCHNNIFNNIVSSWPKITGFAYVVRHFNVDVFVTYVLDNTWVWKIVKFHHYPPNKKIRWKSTPFVFSVTLMHVWRR